MAVTAVRGAIFDLDGVLVDSEPNYFRSERVLLAEYGVDFTPEMKRPYIGMSTMEMLDDVVLRFGIAEPVGTLLSRKNAHYLEIAAGGTPAYPQTRRLVELLHGAGYPLALASGSSPEVIDTVLAGAGLLRYFDVVVSAEAVPRGKPAPDLFLEAARTLDIPPRECVVVEDSEYGVAAAAGAGMRCVAIPYLFDAPLAEAFHSADLLITGGMTGMNPDAVFEWVRSQG